MHRLIPTFCQLFRLRPPLFVTLRGLCTLSVFTDRDTGTLTDRRHGRHVIFDTRATVRVHGRRVHTASEHGGCVHGRQKRRW